MSALMAGKSPFKDLTNRAGASPGCRSPDARKREVKPSPASYVYISPPTAPPSRCPSPVASHRSCSPNPWPCSTKLSSSTVVPLSGTSSPANPPSARKAAPSPASRKVRSRSLSSSSFTVKDADAVHSISDLSAKAGGAGGAGVTDAAPPKTKRMPVAAPSSYAKQNFTQVPATVQDKTTKAKKPLQQSVKESSAAVSNGGAGLKSRLQQQQQQNKQQAQATAAPAASRQHVSSSSSSPLSSPSTTTTTTAAPALPKRSSPPAGSASLAAAAALEDACREADEMRAANMKLLGAVDKAKAQSRKSGVQFTKLAEEHEETLERMDTLKAEVCGLRESSAAVDDATQGLQAERAAMEAAVHAAETQSALDTSALRDAQRDCEAASVREAKLKAQLSANEGRGLELAEASVGKDDQIKAVHDQLRSTTDRLINLQGKVYALEKAKTESVDALKKRDAGLKDAQARQVRLMDLLRGEEGRSHTLKAEAAKSKEAHKEEAAKAANERAALTARVKELEEELAKSLSEAASAAAAAAATATAATTAAAAAASAAAPTSEHPRSTDALLATLRSDKAELQCTVAELKDLCEQFVTEAAASEDAHEEEISKLKQGVSQPQQQQQYMPGKHGGELGGPKARGVVFADQHSGGQENGVSCDDANTSLPSQEGNHTTPALFGCKTALKQKKQDRPTAAKQRASSTFTSTATKRHHGDAASSLQAPTSAALRAGSVGGMRKHAWNGPSSPTGPKTQPTSANSAAAARAVSHLPTVPQSNACCQTDGPSTESVLSQARDAIDGLETDYQAMIEDCKVDYAEEKAARLAAEAALKARSADMAAWESRYATLEMQVESEKSNAVRTFTSLKEGKDRLTAQLEVTAVQKSALAKAKADAELAATERASLREETGRATEALKEKRKAVGQLQKRINTLEKACKVMEETVKDAEAGRAELERYSAKVSSNLMLEEAKTQALNERMLTMRDSLVEHGVMSTPASAAAAARDGTAQNEPAGAASTTPNGMVRKRAGGSGVTLTVAAVTTPGGGVGSSTSQKRERLRQQQQQQHGGLQTSPTSAFSKVNSSRVVSTPGSILKPSNSAAGGRSKQRPRTVRWGANDESSADGVEFHEEEEDGEDGEELSDDGIFSNGDTQAQRQHLAAMKRQMECAKAATGTLMTLLDEEKEARGHTEGEALQLQAALRKVQSEHGKAEALWKQREGELSDRLTECSGEIENLTQISEAALSAMDNQEAELQGHRETVAVLVEQLSSVSDTCANYKASLDDLSGAYEGMRGRASDSDCEMDGMKATLAVLVSDCGRATTERNALEKMVRGLQGRMQQMKAEASDVDEQLDRQTDQLGRLYGVFDQRGADYASLKRESSSLKEGLLRSMDDTEQAVMEGDVLRELLESTLQEKQELEADKIDLTAKYSSTEADRGKFADLMGKLSTARQRAAGLEKGKKVMKDTMEGMTAQVKEAGVREERVRKLLQKEEAARKKLIDEQMQKNSRFQQFLTTTVGPSISRGKGEGSDAVDGPVMHQAVQHLHEQWKQHLQHTAATTS